VNLEDNGVDEKILIKWILKEIGWEAVDWLHQAHVRDKWPAVNIATKFRVP
jgi:hypothetical protein